MSAWKKEIVVAALSLLAGTLLFGPGADSFTRVFGTVVAGVTLQFIYDFPIDEDD